MKADQNIFFRQAAIRICGSLDIEIALWQCLIYLERFIPIDKMYLHLYEKDLRAVRTIASATAKGGQKLDLLTPMTKIARKSLDQNEPPNVRIVNNPELDPVTLEMIKSLGGYDISRLIMRLSMESKRLGAVSLTAKGRDRYNKEHARLLFLLNEPFAIAMSNTLKHQELQKLKDMLVDDNRYLHHELMRQSSTHIAGGNSGLKHVFEMARQVAPMNSPVLILGETGVGKDVIANYIHSISSRNYGPFIKVDCGAIPETLIDSELFGHERGAFTGAVAQQRGRFERACKGTVFLDEIGELPIKAQTRMLRVLQFKEIERVGGSKPIPVDIRIIAATHRDIGEMVTSKEFRKDLWYRLNIFPIVIPPLRERLGDIPALIDHFIEKKSKELKLNIPIDLAPGAMEKLMNYSWPGNVRELENVVERALILNKSNLLQFEHLNLQDPRQRLSATQKSESLHLDSVISNHIQRVLKITKEKIHGPGGAAEILNVNPSTLRNKMKKLGINYGRKNVKPEITHY